MNEPYLSLPESLTMKDLTDSEKILLGLIAGFRENGCYMTNAAIGLRLHWDERKVRRVIEKLRKNNMIDYQCDGHNRTMRFTPPNPVNTVHDNPDNSDRRTRTDLTSNPDIICRNPDIFDHQPGDKCPQIIKDTIESKDNNPLLSPQGGDLLGQPISKPKRGRPKTGIGTNGYTPEFEYFWAYYPRADSKGAAFKAWQKINPDPELAAEIARIAHLRTLGPDWANREKRYIPHASTWLNARGWEDGFELAQEDQ